MAERTTNADIAVALAEIRKDLDAIKLTLGEKPNEGLRGDVAMLVGIKNKGWGLLVGILIFAGAVGASIKSALTDVFK